MEGGIRAEALNDGAGQRLAAEISIQFQHHTHYFVGVYIHLSGLRGVAAIKAKRPGPVIEGGQAKGGNGSARYGRFCAKSPVVKKIAEVIVDSKIPRNTSVQQFE